MQRYNDLHARFPYQLDRLFYPERARILHMHAGEKRMHIAAGEMSFDMVQAIDDPGMTAP